MANEDKKGVTTISNEDKKGDGVGSFAASAMLYNFDGCVTQFNGEDKAYSSTKWAQDIEDNAEIFNWTPQQKLIIARRSLCGTASLWLKAEKVFKTYDELKTALLKEFPEVINTKEMHELMSSRKKNKNESFYQYMLAMKELGKRAKFPDYVSIQYIIDGIDDGQINKVMLYGVTTYSALKEKLTIYEKMVSERNKEEKSAVRKNLQVSSISSRPSRRCFRCGDKYHVAKFCTKGIKCFRCNQYSNHIGSQCPVAQSENGGNDVSEKQSVGSQQLRGKQSATEAPLAWRRSAMFGTSTNQRDDTCKRDIDNHSEEVMSDRVAEVMQVVNKDCKSVGKPVKTVIIAENHSANALIDSGSELNLVSAELCARLFNVVLENSSVTVTGLARAQVRTLGRITTSVLIDGLKYENVTFHILPRDCMPFHIIVGQPFLNEVTVVMKDGCVTVYRNESEWLNSVNCIRDEVEGLVEHINNRLVKQEVYHYINTYHPLQIKEAPLQLRIVLKDDVPVVQRPRRLSHAEQGIVEKQVDEWLKDGIIRVSFSEYSSPLVLVKKKDGTTRVCVDYRQLNSKIVKDEYPLPIIDDLIDKLSHAKVFSVLDLKNGFFHLKISEESIPYTAFVTHHGQYEFLRAPFGLSVSPKYFMRFVNVIFQELLAQKIMMIFIDDIIIPAVDEKQALCRLKQVLEVASQYGLRINWKKAKLIQSEIEYLGHVIKNGEVQPTTEKIDAVMKFPEARTSKQLKSFLGLTSYFRKYIEQYATIAKPLNDLLRKGADFRFNQEQLEAFYMLKEKLSTKPVLKIFDHNLKTELHTDASSVAVSAILMQYHPNSGLHPVQYMSRKTNEAESRYSSYELEAMAVIEGVKKFRHYLYGKRFKLVTDCKAFQQTLMKKDITAKVARWVLMLNEYDFEVEHRAGAKMRHADALSRNPYVAIVTSIHNQIKQAQDQDDGIKAIKEILEEKSYKDYTKDSELLYKGPGKLLVIPKSLEKEIISRVHSKGHFSKRKMKELIGQDYYIKDLDRKLEEFVIACIPCLLATKKEGKQEGFLNPIGKESLPLDTLHVDHVGSLSETRKQYNYILTVIDAFTKFVWLFPTKSTSSAETLNKLRIHQQTFGNARRIITDRGTAYTSHEFEEYCKEENIQHITITTGVPRGNGQVERIHRIIIQMLTKLCIENPGVWYKHVSRVQRALNSTFQRSINTTPYELMIGTTMRCKEDIEIMELLQDETAKQYDSSREELRQKAKEQILIVQEENRKYFNRRRKDSHKYQVGDRVAIKRTQFSKAPKLKAKYLGPYRVTKVHLNDRYEVEKADSAAEGPFRTSTAADQMKMWPTT